MVLIFLTNQGRAQVLFEGYSKITMGGEFLGFVVQRYEYNAAKKNFVSTYLIKYNELGGSMTESLVATANDGLEPVAYTYNMLSPEMGAKTIDAKFEKGKLKITTTEKGRTTKTEKVLPKGTFFSTFLAYVILKNPKGLKASARYDYQAIAEEDGAVYKGTATVQSQENYKGVPVFKILNDFKDAQFISYTTEKGEILGTTSPQKALNLELMPDATQAMGGLSVSADNLRILFGNIPEGKAHPFAAPTGVAPAGAAATSSIAVGAATEGASAPVQVNKPAAIKKLELQKPPSSDKPMKRGARPGIGIQTKSK